MIYKKHVTVVITSHWMDIDAPSDHLLVGGVCICLITQTYLHGWHDIALVKIKKISYAVCRSKKVYLLEKIQRRNPTAHAEKIKSIVTSKKY